MPSLLREAVPVIPLLSQGRTSDRSLALPFTSYPGRRVATRRGQLKVRSVSATCGGLQVRGGSPGVGALGYTAKTHHIFDCPGMLRWVVLLQKFRNQTCEVGVQLAKSREESALGEGLVFRSWLSYWSFCAVTVADERTRNILNRPLYPSKTRTR